MLAVTYDGSVAFDHIRWLKLRLTLTTISIFVIIFSSLPATYIQKFTGTLVAIYLLNYLQALTSEPSLEIELDPRLVFLSQRRQSFGKDEKPAECLSNTQSRARL